MASIEKAPNMLRVEGLYKIAVCFYDKAALTCNTSTGIMFVPLTKFVPSGLILHQKIIWKLGVCALPPAENKQQDKPIEVLGMAYLDESSNPPTPLTKKEKT
ncbi:hypothetical protein [Chryseobacterium sp. SN22]|uniref:hypothetical protein n=1 Tax=Chryseobacterium sp. SN22 TaxID=2606431 RepID=UPI001E4A5C93|nr:hypothetical protein [Chryseobacterium sp. SN22]